MKTRSTSAAAALALFGALTMVGCSAAAPLESAAKDCGGGEAGLVADETGIAVPISRGSDALTCVVSKVFSDKAEQYAVALVADEGVGASQTIGGRDVDVVTMAGETVVFIGAK